MITDHLQRAADRNIEKAIKGNPTLEAQLKLLYHNLKLGHPVSQFAADLKFHHEMHTPGFKEKKQILHKL